MAARADWKKIGKTFALFVFAGIAGSLLSNVLMHILLNKRLWEYSIDSFFDTLLVAAFLAWIISGPDRFAETSTSAKGDLQYGLNKNERADT